jgi:hypothetical protein
MPPPPFSLSFSLSLFLSFSLSLSFLSHPDVDIFARRGIPLSGSAAVPPAAALLREKVSDANKTRQSGEVQDADDAKSGVGGDGPKY